MEEEDLVPGVDGQTFELELTDVHVAHTREELYNTMLNQMQGLFQEEVNARMNDDNNYTPAENQPLVIENQGQNREFDYNLPVRQNVIQELEEQRGNGFEAGLDAERRLQQLRGMVRETGVLPIIGTRRPPVENIQEINLETTQAVGRVTREHLENVVNTVYRGRDLNRGGVETRDTPQIVQDDIEFTTRINVTPRRAGATQARSLDEGLWANAVRPMRVQRAEPWGDITWKDYDEERVRKVENLKFELLEFISTLEETDSIKRIQDYIDRY